MTRLLLFILLMVVIGSGFLKPVGVVHGGARQADLVELCRQFDSVNTLVRDRKIAKTAALKQLQRIMPLIQSAYNKTGHVVMTEHMLVFPLKGYKANAIGGTKGNGYVASGYDYFDGNKHAGHPAHDIFISDKNQDCLDDRTGKPVQVLSVDNGVVVSVVNSWDTASDLRGGKYIWIYDPGTNSLFYYAHNDKVLVSIGQMVKIGDPIAQVGRSGFNAFKKRSPTHLHFTQLVFDKDYYPRAVNPYEVLVKSEVR